jgi:hypothetical protein
VLVGFSLLVAGLTGYFAVAHWEQGNKVATVVSALAAVAAVGVATWAALRGSAPVRSMRVSRTGDAESKGKGNANTGFQGRSIKPGSLKVDHTGDAKAADGDTNTGGQLD